MQNCGFRNGKLKKKLAELYILEQMMTMMNGHEYDNDGNDNYDSGDKDDGIYNDNNDDGNAVLFIAAIRSSLEFGNELWHGSLTNAQSVDFERIHKVRKVWKGYTKEHFCPKMDYNESLAHFRMSTLNERKDVIMKDIVWNLSGKSRPRDIDSIISFQQRLEN